MANSIISGVTADMAQLLLAAANTHVQANTLSAVTDAHTATDADNHAATHANIAAELAEAADAQHEMLSQIVKRYSQDRWFNLQATQPCLANFKAGSTQVLR